MNKFMDSEDIKDPSFLEIFSQLERLAFASCGAWVQWYYKLKKVSISIGPFSRAWEYPWAINNAQLDRSHLVLDAGCGSSPLLLYLYRLGCRCYGIDKQFVDEVTCTSKWRWKQRLAFNLSKVYPFYLWLNPYALEGLSGLANLGKTLRYNIHYTKASFTKLPFKDNTFDRVFCISVLEHVSEKDMFISAKEFNRVLKPGGLLLVTMDYANTGLLWEEFINKSGLVLHGESDFRINKHNDAKWDVVGFVLRKK